MDNDSLNFHNIIDSIEHDYKVKKAKESILLLKQKMCKTDVLIKQYTQNIKEVKNLKSSLEVAKKEAKHIISDYSSAKDEIRELKCKIAKYQQNNEKLTNKMNDYNINIAADKQSIQQLTCKIKELEEEQSAKIMEHNLDKSSFEDKIKQLEHELKTLKKDDISTVTKKGGKKKEKKISTNVDTAKPSISIKSTSDIGINVSLCNIEPSVKCEVRDQNIMTDEFYHTKNDPHPLFCEKCEAHLPSELTPEKIFKTMIACPKLIEKDLPPSPKKIYSPPCSLPNTYPDFTNRNEDSLSKISPIPHLHPYSPCSDSIAGNIKSQSGRSSTTTQICENVELRNTDISHIPLVAKVPSNLNAIPTLSQNRNCAREHFCSDDLLIKHSISIKKMKRKIRSLKSKMKKFRRLKKKINTNSRCCVMNHKDDVSLNSNLISLICKGVAEYFNEKKEACPKNERDIDSEKCTCCSKRTELKRRQSCNAYKSMFSEIEKFDENERVRGTYCDKTENATNITDVLQFNHTSKNILSSVHKNSYSNINISSISLNDIEIDKEFLHKQNTLHSVEVVPVENSFTMSRLSVDKLYVSNDILNKDNIDANDVDNQIETKTMFLFNNKKSLDHVDGRTVDINAEENKIKRKDEIIHKNKSSEICVNDNISSKDNIEDIDMDNQKIEMISLCKDGTFSDYTNDKIVDINAEENKIERKGQSVHKNQVGEIYTKDDFLSNHSIKAIDMEVENQTETRNISNNENSTDNGKIVDINKESEMKRKSQSMHNEIYASDDLFGKNNVKAIDTDNQIETRTIFLSNDTNSTYHAYSKIIDVNAEENKIKTKDQNINEDKFDEIHASDNLLSKSNVETTDTDNQTETKTILLPNNENSTVNRKIIDINADKIEIKRKCQNIYKDELDQINTSDNILSEDNIEAVDRDIQTKTRMTSLSNNENSTDLAHSKNVVISVEKHNVMRKSQNIQKAKIGDRLLKNLRNLKRKKQPISRINKQENIKPYSDHNFENLELAKKPRIENEKEINDSSLNHIKNLKRNLDIQAESINKQTDDKLCSNHYELKKVRIAHTPKMPIHQLSVNRNNSTHCTIRNIATLAIRQKNNVNQQLNTDKDNSLIESKKNPIMNKKYDEENIVKSIETNNIDERPINEKDLDLINAENSLQNNDITPYSINIEHVSELAKCGDVIEDTINKNISIDRVVGETLNDSDESNVVHNNIVNDTANNLKLEKSILLRTRVITRAVYKDLKHDKVSEALDTIKTRKMSPTVELEYAFETFGNKSYNDHISNDESSVLSDRSNVEATRSEDYNNSGISNGTIPRSPSPKDVNNEDYNNSGISNGTIAIPRSPSPKDVNKMKNARNIQEETCISNRAIKMQAIETQNKNLVMSQGNKKMELIFVPHNFEESQAPMSRLYKYINKKKCTKKHKLSCREIKYACKITDKFVKKQLRRLMNSDWKDSIYDSIHDDIKVKLENTCGPRIIAKCIVEFIIDEVDHTEALDKSFTPPAPLMTKFEQKIITLLFDLEASKPMVIYFVQAAIEFHMFRLDSDVKDPIDSLTRIYVVLSRIQKDREKIRMMCCSALYCMNLKSIAVLNTILMCWSEVLPNAEINKEILSKCIAFLISSLHISTDKDRILKKLKHLKSLVSRCHNYTRETINDIVKELMTALKAKRIEGLDTAIILVAKREKAQWTYKNIIQSVLLPMIINNQHPCIYSAFSLLGRLLRAFPLQDKDQIVHDISEQLCVLIQSGQGSHDQQEGIISALLSLSRQKFDVISWPVIKWTPSKSLRPIVDTQLQTFLHTRTSKFWKEYLQKKKIKLIQSKT
ncbi:PREDICTED: uncharacterized protein LOC108745405 [Trachymyrmex septentrionalis]|uniref:uncharacterized protein LOC108745405 n=1 Tax=Trachymyrmex septentrionalis TaxID=34720 RepID=UPI00084F49B2|nr:PREDICTED: uncharacterized protein LOC108745405 [Trachymyrmex septentrionalis]